jgi:hypothetical protein
MRLVNSGRGSCELVPALPASLAIGCACVIRITIRAVTACWLQPVAFANRPFGIRDDHQWLRDERGKRYMIEQFSMVPPSKIHLAREACTQLRNPIVNRHRYVCA